MSCLDRKKKLKTQCEKKKTSSSSIWSSKMQGLASPPRLRLPRASARRSKASRSILGSDRRPRATEESSPAATQLPGDCAEASPWPSPATAPLGDDDAGSSSSDPSQSRRATLIAGGVASGTWIEKKGGKEWSFSSPLRTHDLPLDPFELSLSLLSLFKKKKKKSSGFNVLSPRLPRPRLHPGPRHPPRRSLPRARL